MNMFILLFFSALLCVPPISNGIWTSLAVIPAVRLLKILLYTKRLAVAKVLTNLTVRREMHFSFSTPNSIIPQK